MITKIMIAVCTLGLLGFKLTGFVPLGYITLGLCVLTITGSIVAVWRSNK